MELRTLQKLGGISLITGAVLLTVYTVAFVMLLPVSKMDSDITLLINSPHWRWITLVAFFGVLEMLFGYLAVYTRLYKEAGLVGLAGIVALVIAYILQACTVTWEVFLWPVISRDPSAVVLFKDSLIQNSTAIRLFDLAASISILVGMILFCIAIIRSGKFPKIAGVLVLVGALGYGAGSLLSLYIGIGGILVFSAGCFMVGANLITVPAEYAGVTDQSRLAPGALQ